MGLMQLMPERPRQYGATDPFNPDQNVRAGALYLSSLLQLYGNNLTSHWLPTTRVKQNVAKYGKTHPPFPETVAYVRNEWGCTGGISGWFGNLARRLGPKACPEPSPKAQRAHMKYTAFDCWARSALPNLLPG